MKNNKPLVSVVMTAYNAADFVVESVHSIQAQSYHNWELIIVNDGSTDRTSDLIKDLAKHDRRIHLIDLQKNVGASRASNLGLAKAKGKFIARIDADDISISDRLDKQIEFLLSHPDVIVVGGQCELIDRDGKSIGLKAFPTDHQKIYERLYQYNPIQHPSMMINTKLLGKQKITYHTEVLLAHDLEILFKLAQYGKMANLPDVVLKYRIHNDSLSLRHPKATFKHTLKVRQIAKDSYGYIPSRAGIVVHNVQKIVLTILPSIVVYPLFRMIRMRKITEFRAQLAYGMAVLIGMLSR